MHRVQAAEGRGSFAEGCPSREVAEGDVCSFFEFGQIMWRGATASLFSKSLENSGAMWRWGTGIFGSLLLSI